MMKTLRPINGPMVGTTKTVRDDGTTMADLRLDDGTWLVYDNRDEQIFVVGLQEVDTPAPDQTLIPVREVGRERYTGIL